MRSFHQFVKAVDADVFGKCDRNALVFVLVISFFEVLREDDPLHVAKAEIAKFPFKAIDRAPSNV